MGLTVGAISDIVPTMFLQTFLFALFSMAPVCEPPVSMMEFEDLVVEAEPTPMASCQAPNTCPDGSTIECDMANNNCRCYGDGLDLDPGGTDACQQLRQRCRDSGTFSCSDAGCTCEFDPILG